MGKLKADLEARGFELVETHISWIFLGDDEVFKVKRPVDLGFLDFTTIEKRRAACDAELQLNRRLAPDVYLDVVPITVDASGIHRIAGAGAAVDWAVRMRRLAVKRRADELLRAGLLRRNTSTRSRLTSRDSTKAYAATRKRPSTVESRRSERTWRRTSNKLGPR